MDRRLTTIVAADLAGYSRLMAVDEEGVIGRLREMRRDVIDPAIDSGGGRLFKTMGDGLLIEFTSPVEAVRSALSMQQAILEHQASQEEDQRLRFRIGINLGDVVIDGDDILGDCVNVAARLEGLAPVGGICVSRAVFDQVKDRIDTPMTALGAQSLKNIPEPIEVWQVGDNELVSTVKSPAVTNHERPSIAVLPFENLSTNPDQAFLVDGLVEDIITSLSRFRWLFVISRNSTAALKGQSQDAREIAKSLGVRYVVEGSVRRAGERLRVSYELIDGATGGQVLAERLDRSMIDLFDLQDELTLTIISAMVPEISAYERSRVRSVPATNLTAWELYQRALVEFQTYTTQSIVRAEEFTQNAIKADPGLASAYALLARIRVTEFFEGITANSHATLTAALELAERAVSCDVRSDDAQFTLGFVLNVAGQYSESLHALERAVALNPNNAHCRMHFAMTLLNPEIDRPSDALLQVRTAMLLSPTDPHIWLFQSIACAANMLLGDLDEAGRQLATYRNNPLTDWKSLSSGAVCEVLRGNEKAAKELIHKALARAVPRLASLELLQRDLPQVFKSPHLSDACSQLVKLGMPEKS